MAELNYEFRKRLLAVHKPGRRDFAKTADADQTTVRNGWTIVIPADADRVLCNAARDLEDYFFVSMEISVSVARDFGGGKHRAIVYAVDASLDENAYRIKVTPDAVFITGYDSRAAAQGGYWLEDCMNLAEGPFLDQGEITRAPLYSPRMIHSGFGLDMFPDEHIRAIAHNGINALLIFVKDVDRTPHGYLDFNDLIYRANGYGVDVYCYSYMKSRRHPDDPKAEEFYESVYGRLFDRCPGFKGIVFVGESCEFPSHDEHTAGILRLTNKNPDGTRKVNKTSPGWWPCYDFPEWIRLVKGIIAKRRPDIDFVFWSYNWGWAPEEDRLALLRNIPTDISLLVTFEMFENIERDGVTNRTVDYTLFFEGPGHYFSSEAKLAKERGIRLYSMTNTGGLTWDVGTIPYEPAPYQWMRRYAEMQKAHDNWGLCGTMDSHHFGFWPSFISELAKWAFYSPTEDYEKILRRLAVRDFGEENADRALEAYAYFSDGIRSLISTNYDQYGPFRIGSSYPLTLKATARDVQIPTVFYAHFGGNTICNPVYSVNLSTEEARKKLDYEIKEHGNTAALYAKGAAIIDSIIPTLPARKVEDAKRLAALAHFIEHAATTTVNVKEWHKRKWALGEEQDAAERARIKAEMKEIGAKEIANAEGVIPYVEYDSRLGFEPSMEYMTDRAHIEWKLGVTRQAISEIDEY